MHLDWSEIAWNDYLALQSNKKLLKKVNELLKDIDRNGYAGEPLKEDLSGYWSRRIDEYNRIVYRIVESNEENYVEIIQCCTHYHK